ncbi:hypothetical protein ES708_12424 [subsurface metagenome]
MKASKAVEILELNALEQGSYLPPDYITALKLGIEALKRVQTHRRDHHSSYPTLLPGEDPE